jgi:hypothetical protein
MKVGVPVVLILIPLCWLLLTHFVYPHDSDAIDKKVLDTRPEPWEMGSRLTLLVFFLCAF